MQFSTLQQILHTECNGANLDGKRSSIQNFCKGSMDTVFNKINAIGNLGMPLAWILEETLAALSDNNSALTFYQSSLVLDLVFLSLKLYKITFPITGSWIDMDESKIKDLITLSEYRQQDRYMIEASNGTRPCTKDEVNEAIYQYSGDKLVSIFNQPSVSLTDEENRQLNMFIWMLHGRWKYYLLCDMKCAWRSGKLEYPTIYYIKSNLDVLSSFCDYVLENPSCYNDLVDKLRKIKRMGKYKYSDWEVDSIDPQYSISFVRNQIISILKNKRFDKGDWEVHRIVQSQSPLTASKYLKHSRTTSNNGVLTVEEKLTLRKYYVEYLKAQQELKSKGQSSSNGDSSGDSGNSSVDSELYNMCTSITGYVEKGILRKDEFALRIIDTLKSRGYVYASYKQRQVLIDTLSKAVKLSRVYGANTTSSPNAASSTTSSPSNSGIIDLTPPIYKEFGAPTLSDSSNFLNSISSASGQANSDNDIPFDTDDNTSSSSEFDIANISDLLGSGGIFGL